MVIVLNNVVLEEYYKLIKQEFPNNVDTLIINHSIKEKDNKIEILELKNEILELKMKILKLTK